jgi:hypothetical protein
MNIKKIAAIIGGIAVALAAGSAVFVKVSEHKADTLKALTSGENE